MSNLIYATPNEVRANKNKLKVFKDAFNKELNIGDNVVFGNYYGDVFKGVVEGFTKKKFVIIKCTSALLNGEFYRIYKTPNKLYKI